MNVTFVTRNSWQNLDWENIPKCILTLKLELVVISGITYRPFEELGCKFLHCTDKNIEKLERMSESETRSIITNNSGQTENDFEKFQFYTSTPRKLGHSKSYQNVKEKLNCENCLHKSQCSDCYVNEYIQKQKPNTKICRICDGNIKIEDKEFECGECDKFVCAICAKETHISDEYFTCSPCLLWLATWQAAPVSLDWG